MSNFILAWLVTFCFGKPLFNGNVMEVEVNNISSAKGKILLALYNQPGGFPNNPQKAFVLKSVGAAKGKISVEFTGIPAGTWAIAVFHDENNDGKLNMNALGIPKEAYGFSNNVRPMFSAPSFKEAGFFFNMQKTISIKLK